MIVSLLNSAQAEAAMIGGVIALVGVVVKVLLSYPSQMSAAYTRGRDDESAKCQEQIAEARKATDAQVADLRQELRATEAEVVRLRGGLLRLAVAADLTPAQRGDIALTLGLTHLPPRETML